MWPIFKAELRNNPLFLWAFIVPMGIAFIDYLSMGPGEMETRKILLLDKPHALFKVMCLTILICEVVSYEKRFKTSFHLQLPCAPPSILLARNAVALFYLLLIFIIMLVLYPLITLLGGSYEMSHVWIVCWGTAISVLVAQLQHLLTYRYSNAMQYLTIFLSIPFYIFWFSVLANIERFNIELMAWLTPTMALLVGYFHNNVNCRARDFN
jgi:hypothetical protein